MKYTEFLENKDKIIEDSGFPINKEQLNENLYEFQKDIVKWSLRKGKAAIFADCGLGKTLMQLEWSNQVCKHTGGNVLILAPLAVTEQTQREGIKFGINVIIAESMEDVRPGINITNYEKLDRFNTDYFEGIVLDESSIYIDGKGQIGGQCSMFGD